MKRILSLPYYESDLEGFSAGDEVILFGTLYVGRDQVHKRLKALIDSNCELPFQFEGNGIYYMGPSPAPDGYLIGAAGPTTSQRMDPFSPLLIANGLKLMVGKGPRSKEVKASVKEYKGAYLQAFGGCGALYSNAIKKVELVAFPELGPEALLRLEIEDFPTICAIDSRGNAIISYDVTPVK